MRNKLMNHLLLLFLIYLNFNPFYLAAQRCAIMKKPVVNFQKRNPPKEFIGRNKLNFRLIFHVFYSSNEEKISSAQINSQLEILNNIFHTPFAETDASIPAEFRALKRNPDFLFCLADKDPNGMSSTGINWKQITDRSIACKMEFGKRSIMHDQLGGLDVWNPKEYINIYVVNREQCPVLGEAIYPWDATMEEDGIILDYRTVGTIGAAAKNQPFHQGKTLVHELGHYFGLLHLSGDKSNCLAGDSIADTPPQSTEYQGCPVHPLIDCNEPAMFMNFMSLVDDPCMKLFTANQVSRMRSTIEMYRSKLGSQPCTNPADSSIEKLIINEIDGFWQLVHEDDKSWNGDLELYTVLGKICWKSKQMNVKSKTIPESGMFLSSGIYFLVIRNNTSKVCIKLFKN